MSHREVMQQALEAIRIFREWEMGQDYESCRATVLARALAAEESLGAALAEPTCKDDLQVEPVAWMDVDDRGNMLSLRFWSEGGHEEVPLYTHPAPQRQPQEPRWNGDDNIESPHNACMHKSYCLTLKAQATQCQPLTDEEIIAANYPDGEEVEPIIAAPDSELIAFSRAVMAVQRDKKGRPIAYWSGLTEARKDDTTRPQRQPLSDEEIDRVTDAQWAANNHKPVYAAHRAFARAIEAAHGITGEEQ